MKKTGFLKLTILCGMVFLSGCFFPRYTTICEIEPSYTKSAKMSLQEASRIISDTIENVPAGRRPDRPADKTIGKYATSVRLRTHNRTGLVLVEVYEGSRVTLEFYVRTQEDGERFADAVWRLRQEYKNK